MPPLPRWWAISLLTLMYSDAAFGSESSQDWPKPLQVVLAVVSNNAGPAAWSRTHYELADLLEQSPNYNRIELDKFPLRPTDDSLQDCGKSFSCWQEMLLNSSADMLVLVQITETPSHIDGRVWLLKRSMTTAAPSQRYRAPLDGGAPPDILQRILENPGQIEVPHQETPTLVELNGEAAPLLSTGNLGPIPPGKHQLRIRSDTELLQVRVVTMTPGAELVIAPPARPHASVSKPARPYRGWAAVGIVLAGATAAIVISGVSPGHGQSNALLP